jgi:FtsP/CotA-like multicopper oxidase with cupredoxin domain
MNRRAFLKSTLAGATALSLSPKSILPAWAGTAPDHRALSIVRRTIEANGRAASVFGLVGTDGEPGLSFRAGDAFNVVMRNETAEPTIVHWHGLTPPWSMDGVPNAPLPLLEGNAERSFNFPVGSAGTFWMHAHTLQEQVLLAAPLIVRSGEDEARDEQEVVILLHDFSFATPEELLAGLRKGSASHGSASAGGAMPMGQGGGGHAGMAGMAPMAGMESMAGMQASMMAGTATNGAMAMDLNDIDYDAYLANDRTLEDPEVVPIERGGRVRVRVINGATATAFTMDFGSLQGTLIAVDGQGIEPIVGSRFPLAMGQRIDVRLELPREARSFPILALREGEKERTGVILRPSGAAVAKIASVGNENAPVVDLALESDLRAHKPFAGRAADKRFDMVLTGGMQGGYVWGLQTPVPILVNRGDRVEVTMRNQSMMAHPMHLHGHHFQVVAIDGQRFSGAVRDTVHIPPMRSVTIAADAKNPGQWAFHCHHLYHMAAGMMATFAYSA